MTDATRDVLKALPHKLLRPLLSIAVALAAYLLYTNYRPEVMQAPMQKAIAVLQVDVSALHVRVDTIAARQEQRISETAAMQRWMCFQNRTDAVKAGIPCKRLLEE